MSSFAINNLSVQSLYQEQLYVDLKKLLKQNQKHPIISCLETLLKTDTDPQAAWQFIDLYMRGLLNNKTSTKTDLTSIQPLKENDVPHYNHLKQISSHQQADYWKRLAVIKLNGGLGTSMGCEGPKSLIKVSQTDSFLDIILKQHQYLSDIYQHASPLLFLNSLFTDTQSKGFYQHLKHVRSMIQHQFPRILKTSLASMQSETILDACYPPGHGDIYGVLEQSGNLNQLIEQGYDYAFISNSDNLAAIPDMNILAWMIAEKCDFLMEVTPKTRLDVKGGALIKHKDRVALLERADVADHQVALFEDISTFQLFNTNNIWLNLKALKKQLQKGLPLPVIKNEKNIQNQSIIQLETAMGSAISVFPNAKALIVHRNRFMPIKKTSDLFLLQSNLVSIKKQSGQLVFTFPEKELPKIDFCSALHQMSTYQQYVKKIPCLKRLSSLKLTKSQEIKTSMKLIGDVVL